MRGLYSLYEVWGGYDEQAPEKYRSLLQNIVSFVGLFLQKKTCNFKYPSNYSHPIRICALTHEYTCGMTHIHMYVYMRVCVCVCVCVCV